MEILGLLNEESISGAAVVELVYKFDEKSYCKCLKGESISKVRFKIFFRPQTYMDTTTDHFTPLACGVIIKNHPQYSDIFFKALMITHNIDECFNIYI